MTMEQVRIDPGIVSGRVRIPASKSLSHRAIICAALAEGESRIFNTSWSRDIEATVIAMERLGAIVRREGSTLCIRGIGGRNLAGHVERIFCGESGSTVRFLIPVAGVLKLRAIFTGVGKLPKRPLDSYLTVMQEHGFDFEQESEDYLPLLIKDPWTSGVYEIAGDISSQFITGLLLALPMAEGDSEIVITTKLESRPYIDLTLDVLEAFGVHVENDGYRRFHIPGGQQYQARDYEVEADYSQAAAFLAAGACAGDEEGVILDGLRPDSRQGDSVVLDLLDQMHVRTSWLADGGLKVEPSENLTNIVMNAEQCPDLVPVMAALSSFGQGRMRITHAERLRIKESDRLKAVATELKKMGVDIQETSDGLVIQGQPDGLYEGGEADSWKDHRIAMCLSILALRTFRGIELKDAGCVNKSWPTYWEDLTALGGTIE